MTDLPVITVTWRGGPTFLLTRTTLEVALRADDEERALSRVPALLRGFLPVRSALLRPFRGPHFLTGVRVESIGPATVLNLPNGRELSWRVPEEDQPRVEAFVEKIRQRRALRSLHRAEKGRGRSFVSLALFAGLTLWLIRRIRSA